MNKRFTLFCSCLALVCLFQFAYAQTGAGYDSLVQQGKSQLQAGDAFAALTLGERAIKLDRTKWQAYALSGGALMNLKRYEQAADSFSKAIDLAPEAKQASLRDLRKQCVLAEARAVSPASAGSQATPPQSAASATQAVGPSIEVTLKFISDLMTAESPIAWQQTVNTHDERSPETKPNSYSYRSFSQNGCILHYEGYDTSYGWKPYSDNFAELNARSLKIETYSDIINKFAADEGTNYTWSTSPTIYIVDGFYLGDRSRAERLMKAITHAAELCGGTKNQPF